MRAYERLIRYAKFDTPSHSESETCPSTPEQKLLGAALAEEMQAMGMVDVRMDAHGYVYGRIPANIPDCTAPAVGFIAHMDVATDVPCTGVKPQVLHYEGESCCSVQKPVRFSARQSFRFWPGTRAAIW